MESHLLQMRGLKQNNDIVFIRFERSHLLQMRGLKRLSIYNHRTTKTNQKYPSVNL